MKPHRLVSALSPTQAEPVVRHYRGFPPELSSGKDQREQLSRPIALAIEEKADGVFLLRIDADGQVAGDTWHLSIDEAKEQAIFEFPHQAHTWTEVPDGDDIFEFALINWRQGE